MNALNAISQVIPVIIPLHPRTQKLLDTDSYPYLNLIEPVGYFDMLFFLVHCKEVFLPIAGGCKKRHTSFQKPCITLRDETEWTELVKYGFNTLVGHDYDKIINAEKQIKNQVINNSTNLYGEGNAGNKIIKNILTHC